MADAVGKGAEVLLGGGAVDSSAGGGLGSFFEPTILAGATTDMRVFGEETFGPVAPLFRFDDEEEAVALANDVPVVRPVVVVGVHLLCQLTHLPSHPIPSCVCHHRIPTDRIPSRLISYRLISSHPTQHHPNTTPNTTKLHPGPRCLRLLPRHRTLLPRC